MLKKRIICALMSISMLFGTFFLGACNIKEVYASDHVPRAESTPLALTPMSVTAQDITDIKAILTSTGLGTVEGPNDCGDGTYMYRISGMALSDYHEFCRAFKNSTNGYTESNIRKWGDAQFRTYSKNDICVELNYYPACTAKSATESAPSEEIRCIVSGENYYTKYPEYFTESTSSGSTQPLFTQVGLNFSTQINGMSYLLRTSENTFIIVDGGWTGQGEASYLYELMKEQSGEQKPTIAAWILTHPHSDHIGTIAEFIKAYGGEIIPEAVIFNFQGKEALESYDDYYASGYDTLYSALSDGGVWSAAKFIKPHTGEILYIDGAVIKIMFTIEDCYYFYPIQRSNGNTMVFSVEISTKKILVTGDTYGYLLDNMIEWYGESVLKSDIMTVIHHGRTNGSKTAYQSISPTIAAWPTSRQSYFEDTTQGVVYCNLAYNVWLTENVAHNLFCYEGTYVIKLSDLSYELQEREIASSATPISTFAEFSTMISGQKYYLVNDITVPSSACSDFLLPASCSYILDGCGHSITVENGTTVTASSFITNLCKEGTEIKNLRIGTSKAPINLTKTTNIGIIAGTVSGDTLLENVHVYANITDTTANRNNQVGGLVGKANGNLTIRNCSFTGTFITSGNHANKYFGGLVGNVTSGTTTITASRASFTANAASPSSVGHLIGNVDTNAKIYSCFGSNLVGKGQADITPPTDIEAVKMPLDTVMVISLAILPTNNELMRLIFISLKKN